MISRAISKYNRISPRKASIVMDSIRGLAVPKAYAFLANINKKASYFIANVLKSAVDNAKKRNPGINEADLFVSTITADGGPMLKRFRAGSMGRAFPIRKRTCHITVCLDEKSLPGAQAVKKPASKKADKGPFRKILSKKTMKKERR